VVNETEERIRDGRIFSKSIRYIEYIDLPFNKGDVRFVDLNSGHIGSNRNAIPPALGAMKL